MNIGECILVGLGIITAGIVAIVYLDGKYDIGIFRKDNNKK